MVGGHRSHKNDEHQHLKDIPTRQRTAAGASHHVDSRHRLQQLRQFKKTFIYDIEQAINRGKELKWDSKSWAIWEDQVWELNSMDMEGPMSAIWDALLDQRNRFLQPYIAHLEDELNNVELGSRDKKKMNSLLLRLKEEHEMTGKCEDAKEFFDWYFSRETQEDSDNDSIRGRGEHIGRGTQNSRKETTSRNRDSSRDPYFGSQTRSISPSTSIRSQSTIGDISGSGLESEYGELKYMVETYIKLLKSHITTARKRGWTCKTYSTETGTLRSRYLWEYWRTIKSDLQSIQYDDELFHEYVAEAWTEFLESYKMQLHLERKSYEGISGVENELQRCNSRIKQTEDELAVIRKSTIFSAFVQFHMDKQPSDDTSAYEPRTGERNSHSDIRYASGIAKGHTRNSSQPAQSRSPTPDRYRNKFDPKTAV